MTKNSIDSIAKKYWFAENTSVEKFVMDFEVQSHIAEKMDCVVRGGMCTPFYAGGAARRISVDVDLLTTSSVSEAASAIESSLSLDEFRLEKHEPKNPYPLDNLLTYYVYFDSCLGGKKKIKIDAFCDAQIEPKYTAISAKTPVIGFHVPRDMRILSRGWLLGDKMTALALNTVGLRPKLGKEVHTEVSKQVYDMAVLLRSASREEVVEALDAFRVMTSVKASKFGGGMHTVREIASDIAASVPVSLSLKSAIAVTSDGGQGYNNFNSTYMPRNAGYRKTHHITDILMVCVFAEAVHNHAAGKMEREEAAAGVYDAVSTAVKVEGGPRGSLPPKPGRHAKILKNAQPEHVVLVEKASALF